MLFLQRLPINIRMVLALTQSGMPINELAQLADNITDMAILEIAGVSVQPSSSELESLRAEIISLKQKITSLRKLLAIPVCHIIAI